MTTNITRHSTILLSSGHLLNDFYCNFLPVLLPIIMPRLGLSLTLSGLMVMVMSITSNMLQPVFGYLLDRHNMSRLLIPVIPFGAMCICAIGFVTTKSMLFLLVALTGLSVSTFHPLGSALVAKTTAADQQGSSVSYYIAGGNMGYAFSPIVLVAFTAHFDLTALPWLILPSLLLAFLYWRSNLSSINTCSDLVSAAPVQLRQQLLNPAILRLNLSMGLRCWTHVSVSTFLPLLLIGAGYSAFLSGTLLTLFLIGCTLGGLIGGALGDRFRHKTIITAGLILSFFPTCYFFLHPGTQPLSLLALFLSGGCLLAPQPSSIVWAQRLMPANTGMASGLMMGFSFGLGSIGTAITAAVADHIGLTTALLLTSLPLLLAAAVSFLTPEK